MTIWALADTHLAFSVPSKSMEAFGPLWEKYTDKIEANWRRLVSKNDLVLIAGDITWAMTLEEALIDLKWIDALPGTKVILKGNHDYWWSSNSKMSKVMPPSIHFIHNNSFDWGDATIGGARLWDSPEYNFNAFVHFQENPLENREAKPKSEESEKIFLRDLERLKLSLGGLNPKAKWRLAMTHYPPIGADLQPSRASAILEEFRIHACLFGHLHSLKKTTPLFGQARGVQYHLTSCDYIDFTPIRVI
jgi:uncharacterized protein